MKNEVTKWMKKPLADHDWTPKEIDNYYMHRQTNRIEAKKEREKHNGQSNNPTDFEEVK